MKHIEYMNEHGDRILREIGVPEILAHAKLDDIDPIDWSEIGSILIKHRGLYLLGNTGRGKSHLAVAILRWSITEQLSKRSELESTNDSVKRIVKDHQFIDVSTYLHRIRETFSKDSKESESDLIDNLCNCKMLVLDDLGVSKSTEWANSVFDMIINFRYNTQKTRQTIVTSNLRLETLSDKYGDRIASRIAGMCDVFEVGGRDRRLHT